MARNAARKVLTMGRRTDVSAAAWAAAVTAAGGTYSAATLAAVSAFCASAKASNYWSKLNRINLFCGNQLAAALVPLKVGGGSATDTNVNFVAGDYTEATGLTGNGSTKYLRTGLIPSATLTLNDTHLNVYNRSSSASASVAIGAFNSATQELDLYAPSSDSKAYSSSYTSASQLITGVLATPFGNIVGSRTSSTAHAVYRNGSSQATTAVASTGTLPSLELYVFGLNNMGSMSSALTGPLAAYSIGSGLTAGDVTAYDTHMQAFQTALGRNV